MAKTATDSIITGTVESIDDPTCAGRIKVRIPGMNDNIALELLPWCNMASSGTTSGGGGGSISVPEVGSQVRVTFKDDDPSSMEWTGINQVDTDLVEEIKSDYAGSTVLMHDSRQDATIKFQRNSGMTMYYGGSHVQLCPDNTVNIHYGEGNSGTMIQLADGKTSIQGKSEVNLSTPGTVAVEGDSIALNGTSSVQIKGDTPGECAVNGIALMTLLQALAEQIDMKMPMAFGSCVSMVNMMKDAILNEQIQYI